MMSLENAQKRVVINEVHLLQAMLMCPHYSIHLLLESRFSLQ